MSCNICTTKFNFFHKELGCPNCGLSFCSKCLKQKCKLPDRGNAEFNVCKTCYVKLMEGSSSQSIVPPPDIFLKRLEFLENPSAPPITVYKNDQKFETMRMGLSVVDQQLVDRLEKLKEGKNPPPSEGELRERLATLKGENAYVEGPSKHIQLKPASDQENVDTLLQRFVHERDIEFMHNPQVEIEARLASLRGKGVRPNEGAYVSNLRDSSSSEEEVDKLTKKIMSEVALDAHSSDESSTSQEHLHSPVGDKEVYIDSYSMFCVDCDEYADVKCADCNYYSYCANCSERVHHEMDWEEERTHRIIKLPRLRK